MADFSTPWHTNDYYSPEEKAALYEQIPRRFSCRRFFSAPSTQQWEELNAAAERLALPGVRIALAFCSTDLFQPLGGILMKFENVQRYAAVIARESQPANVINGGVSGEMFLLEAVRLGLAGVWVTGTYKRKDVNVPLAPGEKLLGLIALGVPPEGEAKPVRNRKPVESYIVGSVSPDKQTLMKDLANAVRQAPSAMNTQPCRLSQTAEGEMTLSVGRPAQRLDLGIGCAHLLLALGNTPVEYCFDGDGLTVRMKRMA